MVYVMTVLEHYSDHECSLLLGCARRDVLPVRTRALEKSWTPGGNAGSTIADRRLTDHGPDEVTITLNVEFVKA